MEIPVHEMITLLGYMTLISWAAEKAADIVEMMIRKFRDK